MVWESNEIMQDARPVLRPAHYNRDDALRLVLDEGRARRAGIAGRLTERRRSRDSPARLLLVGTLLDCLGGVSRSRQSPFAAPLLMSLTRHCVAPVRTLHVAP